MGLSNIPVGTTNLEKYQRDRDAQIILLQRRLDSLETQMRNLQLGATSPTDVWTPVDASPLTGTCQYRVANGFLYFVFELTGTIPVGANVFATLPDPTVFPDVVHRRGPCYLNGAYDGIAYITLSGQFGIAQQTGASRTYGSGSVIYPLPTS